MSAKPGAPAALRISFSIVREWAREGLVFLRIGEVLQSAEAPYTPGPSFCHVWFAENDALLYSRLVPLHAGFCFGKPMEKSARYREQYS